MDAIALKPAAEETPHFRPSLAEAQTYCRRLARAHYENFSVASFLVPKPLRQHFFNVYAYCRTADDLADETRDAEAALELLDDWGRHLEACYRGECRHPVFAALQETIGEFAIPQSPFADLLVAFKQDQTVRRYDTFEELLGYCRNSANPVGRIVLHLGRCHDERTAKLSDGICTGLQLANFWQDVARDLTLGRVYLPHEDCERFGYRDEMLAAREFNEPFRRLLEFEVAWARGHLESGWPLVDLVPRELRVQIALFISGGLAVLDAVAQQHYNVWRKRPTVSKRAKLGILWRCWRRYGGRTSLANP